MGVKFPDATSFAEQQKKSGFMHTWEKQVELWCYDTYQLLKMQECEIQSNADWRCKCSISW